MSKNWNMTSKTLIRASYYDIFDRNQHSERLPPPFIFIALKWKNQNFPLFRGRTQYSWVPRWRCPPFLNFWKVQNMIYKFCMYHLSSKCVVFALQTHVIKTNQPSYYARERSNSGKLKIWIMSFWAIWINTLNLIDIDPKW